MALVPTKHWLIAVSHLILFHAYYLGLIQNIILQVKKGKKVKQCIAVNGTPILQLRDVTCHMGSHSVTGHPTQVNAPRLNPSQ